MIKNIFLMPAHQPKPRIAWMRPRVVHQEREVKEIEAQAREARVGSDRALKQPWK
ncbi:hypothetical protein CCACVL1_22582 [Corchorus capsularis]|uniref:Uncharacterized protein n=1 Tax=Corchorus capsularis TaxID=210143 RepID=A0A1R3GY02_COCAP|nr:hypothetical protein CCACVL1_22582 [Corchorus capsularis]